MNRRIGLFGGTFDPPHLGHTRIARAFADQLALDTVIFLPAGDPYHKTAPRAPAADRLAMTRAAAAADPRFAVSDLDIVRSGATYTADTVRIFRQRYPAAALWWLVGADSLAALPQPLHHWTAQALADGSLRLLSASPDNISSTDIRGRLKTGKSTADLLDPAVAAYIHRHGLYTDDTDTP